MIKTFVFVVYTFFADGSAVVTYPEDLGGLTANECAFLLTLDYAPDFTIKGGREVVAQAVACEEEREL